MRGEAEFVEVEGGGWRTLWKDVPRVGAEMPGWEGLPWAPVSAMLAGSATALKYAAEGAPATQMMAGLAEAAVAGVLGFAFLAVAWLLAAVGFRRQT